MNESQTYTRYGRQDGKAHLVAYEHDTEASLCGLSADEMEDGIYVAYECERCHELAGGERNRREP